MRTNLLPVAVLLVGAPVALAQSAAVAPRITQAMDANDTAETLGWTYCKQAIYNAAIDLLQEAVQGNPKSASYHYHLGLAYEKSSNLAMAKKELEYALKVDPNDSQAGQIEKILAEAPQTN